MELVDILKMIAPGTQIREGLDSILKAKTGALIVIGDGQKVMDLVDGGFTINVDYTPARLYELAKMDGAIILSQDLKKILFANAQLMPDSSIPTLETGTRHRTAERVSKKTGNVVISISQRREIITIYNGKDRYILENTSRVAEKANQALQTVEKYRKVFDNKIAMLNEFEFNDMTTISAVIETIQRIEMLMRVADDLKKSIYELGTEGKHISMQLNELVDGVDREELLILKDYIVKKDIYVSYEKIRKLSYEDLLKMQLIASILGIKETDNFDEITVIPKGYRILNKIPRMPNNIVENIIKKFKNFQGLLLADIKELDNVEGIGEIRSKAIIQALKRMQEQLYLTI